MVIKLKHLKHDLSCERWTKTTLDKEILQLTRFDSNEFLQLEKSLALNPEAKFFRNYRNFFRPDCRLDSATSPISEKSAALEGIDGICCASVTKLLGHFFCLLKAVDKFEFIENAAIIQQILDYYVQWRYNFRCSVFLHSLVMKRMKFMSDCEDP